MQGIYVGGGILPLIKKLHEGLIETVKGSCRYSLPWNKCRCNVACPTMMTTNDMLMPSSSFESFGIVPFQINPHHPGKILFMVEELKITSKSRSEDFRISPR